MNELDTNEGRWASTPQKRALSEAAQTVDKHVGERVRDRRLERGVTQQELAAAMGISYQQVQKYENGANRISCGRLALLAEALGVEPGFFFEGRPSQRATIELGGVSEETVQIARDLGSLADPRVRKSLRSLVRALSGRGSNGAE